MDQFAFVKLSLAAFTLVVLSFVVLGFGRLVVPFRTAQLFAAPIGIAGFLLVVYLTVRAALSMAGVWKIEESGS